MVRRKVGLELTPEQATKEALLFLLRLLCFRCRFRCRLFFNRGLFNGFSFTRSNRFGLGWHRCDWLFDDLGGGFSFGFARERVLLQLSTKTVEEGLAVPEVNAPEGVEIRTYQPGDEVRWREINNAAFSWHPEQGNQSAQDYARIVEDPSFDPESVFFAVHNGDIVGFHHTKIHTNHPSGLTMGEVYVIGVDPHVHSKGLGTALMNAGMRHLLDSGVDAIELYVESDNDAALHVYKKLGFVNEIRHISYAPQDHT